MGEHQCFCCNRIIEIESDENPMVLMPAYDGVWFRAYGNFGSTVFDPIVEKIDGIENFLQILICDECIKTKIERVAWIHNIKRNVTADIDPFKSRNCDDGESSC